VFTFRAGPLTFPDESLHTNPLTAYHLLLCNWHSFNFWMNSVTVASYAIHVHMQNSDIAPNALVMCGNWSSQSSYYITRYWLDTSGKMWSGRIEILVYFSNIHMYIDLFAGKSNVLQQRFYFEQFFQLHFLPTKKRVKLTAHNLWESDSRQAHQGILCLLCNLSSLHCIQKNVSWNLHWVR